MSKATEGERQDLTGAIENLRSLQQAESGDQSDWGKGYFDGHISNYKDIVNLVEEYLESPILEVGSMPYHLSYLLDELGYEVIATDINPYRMPDIPRASGFDVIACDVEKNHFPIKSNSVSSVLFTEVLEHLRINPVLTLREIRRVLKPDGKMLLTTPNGLSMFNIKSLVSSGKVTDPYEEYHKLEKVGHMGHVREYTPAEVRSLLTKTGWNIEWSSTVDWPNGGWRERSLTYSLGLAVASIVPSLRKHQVHLATPAEDF